MNQAERNKAVLEQMHGAMQQKGLAAQAEFFAERSHNHGLPTSRDDIRAVLDDIVATFPDIVFEPHEIVAEGDAVMVRYTLSGTHTGVQKLPFVHGGFLAGVAPTGKTFSTQHIHIFRLRDGLVVKHDAVQDNLSMARQLGLGISNPPKETDE